MEPDPTPSPRRARRRRGGGDVSGREYVGCGLWVAAFVVLVALSFAVGVLLRPDRGPGGGGDAVTLLREGTGDGAYRLDGYRDEADDPCLELLRPGRDEEVTGQCGFTTSAEGGPEAGRYVVTSSLLPDGTTVVFGPVPRQAEEVRLRLSDGTRPTVTVRRSEQAGLSWFSHETRATVDGPAEVLDGAGDPIAPPR
ncbi:MAG TPA: hypothetical protein VEW93_05305 [Acidimicrobiales bacterium]|nr:hypothetical protein [Acidimicrobiales bacterium]